MLQKEQKIFRNENCFKLNKKLRVQSALCFHGHMHMWAYSYSIGPNFALERPIVVLYGIAWPFFGLVWTIMVFYEKISI